jgi:uncharacterized protein
VGNASQARIAGNNELAAAPVDKKTLMLLDLSEIVIRQGMRVGLDVDQPSVEDPDLVFAEPLKGHLKFENGGDLISMHGKIATRLRVPCSRCLTDVLLPIELEIEEHLPIENVLHPNKPPDPEEDFDTDISSIIYLDQGRPILDLDELLRQLIVSEVPIRTLCDEACAGLCPTCGANRNETPCACAEKDTNSPFAALGSLLSNGDSGKE